MKKDEVLARAMKGEVLTVVEYRGSKVEKIAYQEKTTKEAKSFDKLAHSVETASESFKVDEDTRKVAGFDAAKYQAPFRKGQQVVAILTSFMRVRDGIEARGHLEALEA